MAHGLEDAANATRQAERRLRDGTNGRPSVPGRQLQRYLATRHNSGRNAAWH